MSKVGDYEVLDFGLFMVRLDEEDYMTVSSQVEAEILSRLVRIEKTLSETGGK